MAESLAIISVISNIISLVEFSDRVLTRLSAFAKAGHELPAAFASLSRQLPLLINVLETSKRSLQTGDSGEDGRKALAPLLEGCREEIGKLDKILAKLVPETGDSTRTKLGKAVRSLWKESEIEEISQNGQTYVSSLTFYCAWSSSNLNPLNSPCSSSLMYAID